MGRRAAFCARVLFRGDGFRERLRAGHHEHARQYQRGIPDHDRRSGGEEDGPAITHNRVGFWRGEGDELEYLFTQDAFRLEVCQGANPDSVAHILDAAGFLKKDPQGNYKKTHTPPRLGRSTRLYTVSGNTLNADD